MLSLLVVNRCNARASRECERPEGRISSGRSRSRLALVIVLIAPSFALADAKTGEQLYRESCARCHGATGEGTKRHKQPLVGEKSVPELAKLIAKTMPEDDPGSLPADEAQKVAAYIHDAFYSKVARDRNKPPRVELARLTVRQYRQSVADLVGSFRWTGKWDEQRGLKGEYFKSRHFRDQDRVVTRVDPEVRFDFGIAAPAEKIEPHEFSLRWAGSVLAPETGEYEFIVHTEHATRLWVNDTRKPLIDAWVKSGNDTEYRGSIFLVGGRAYPLRLEYSKAKQGVDDSKGKPKPPPAKSSIRLEWKPPRRTAEVIPTRNLSPNPFPESFAVSTAFPPDDRSYGWERGTTVSKEWDAATTDAAIETANYVTAKLNELAGTRDGAADRPAKLREFCRRFAERAFRRPLNDEQKKTYIDRQFEAARDPDAAVKRVVLLVLKSPRFLYREVGAGSEALDVAARLSFGLWDSLPDQALLEAASAGKLTTRDQVAVQAERMLGDQRARAKLRGFFLHWLRIEHAPDVAKDPKRFPGFDAALVNDLRMSLELFLDECAWGEKPDFRQLLLADHVYLNGRLAKFYGANLPADAGFQKVKLNENERAGVLTHPYMMAAFAYTGESSPIHRGVFVARGVLGLTLRPPPEAFTPLSPDLHPSLTTRERVVLQTKSDNCMSCHGVINPLGFTLEHFDAAGRFRDKDNNKPIDAAGSYQTRTRQKMTFAGPRDLAKYLANSEEVHSAFVEQLFHHLVQQPMRAYGPRTLEDLRASFVASGYNIRKLVVEVLITAALQNRKQAFKAPFNPAAYSHIGSVMRANTGQPRQNWKPIP